jgi:hypothetical protein
MGKRQIEQYIFDPAARTLKVIGNIKLEDLLLVTNVTDGIIIFNFADPGKGATRTWTSQGTQSIFSPFLNDGYTTFTFTFDTTAMSSTDKLNIYIDDEHNGTKIRPWDFGTDAIERMRTANPQSLIDADFEYGLQSTKWQNLGLNANIPSFFENPGVGLAVSEISSNGASPYSVITVTVAADAPAVGSVVSIFGTTNTIAEGLFIVASSNGTTSFTYQAKGQVGTGTNSIYTPYSVVKSGGTYDGTPMPLSTMTGNGAGGIVTVVFDSPHGLFPSSPITVVDSTAGTQSHEGNFFVTKVVDASTLEYDVGQTVTSGSISVTNVSIYARTDAFFIHRPFDGGVLIGPYLPAPGLEAKRQTKRYFRYQSGKGILFSTGTLFCPTYDIQNATYSSPDITFTTQLAHGVQEGVKVEITDIDSTGYTGNFIVKEIVNDYTFKVAAGGTTPTDATADLGLQPRVIINEWHGTCVRTGMFDDTNGLFWAYEGDNLCVVRRSSTFQTAGFCSVTNSSTTVSGTNTRFVDQLRVGEYIALRGQRYRITTITSNTELSVAPEYRGVTASNIKACLIREFRVNQTFFNMDKLDGTGPSGYTFNPKLMQMLAIQWSWYGAGFADFMIRGPNGEFITAHRFVNNNVNFEAYMRTGNLPARYEAMNESPVFYLAAASGTSGDLTLNNAIPYPNPEPGYPAHVILTSSQSGTTYQEIISYTGKSGNTLTGTTRATTFSRYLAGSNRTFSASSTAYNHPAGTPVQVVPNCAPTLSHWGSAVIMDGGFDIDTGYLFSLSDFDISVASGTTETILLFRPAPSVSNTLAGALGEREIINRSIIKFQDLEIQCDRNIEIAGILNPTNVNALSWANASSQTLGTGSNPFQPSFSQYVANANFSSAPVGGEIIFRYIAPGLRTSKQTFDLRAVKEIENSIVGGNNTYPDGPEVLAIVVRNRTNQTAVVDFSIRWTEAQA